MLGEIVIRRMKEGTSVKLRQWQAGFLEGTKTIAQISILWNMIEQAFEWKALLVLHFIDFENAFDCLRGDGH